MFGLPFEKYNKIWVYAPCDFSLLNEVEARQSQDVRKLIEAHKKAIERELGCPLEFTSDKEVIGAKWFIGPSKCNPLIQKMGYAPSNGPSLFLDRDKGILISDGLVPDEVTETYSYLRSLSHFKGGLWKIKDCENLDEAISRVKNEIQTSYPSFELHRINWELLCEKHIPLVKSAQDPIAAIQAWLAELNDAHTWLRPFPAYGNFPYDFILQSDSLIFYKIAEDSLAFQSGVRPGFKLLVSFENIKEWQLRAGASSHSKAFVIGSRLLAGEIDKDRHFQAISPEGVSVEWMEKPKADRWSPIIEWRKLASGNGYIRIKAWLLGKNFEEQVDAIFKELRSSPRLIVDLRANPGGNLLLAHHFRNRFLKEERQLGWIQNTLPDGTLSEKEAIYGTMVPFDQRWHNEVIFLTDPLTYSASEDAILGLQGQGHVKVIGKRSGGGSGRMRNLRLLPGWRITISTALTYDLYGNCIEGHGIPIDHEFPFSLDENFLIHKADMMKPFN